MIFNEIITDNKAKVIIRGSCNTNNFILSPVELETEMGKNIKIYLNSLVENATIDNLNITDNGISVKNSFIKQTEVLNTKTKKAISYITSGSLSNSSYASSPINVGSDTTTTTTGNIYSSSGTTGYINYGFDFSDLMDNVIIKNLTLTVKGHRENTTIDSTHMAKLQVFCNGVEKSQAIEFTKTTDEVITVPFTGYSMTVSELKQCILRFSIAHYGGRLTGITWSVDYMPLSFWEYSLNNIDKNHTIVVS